MTNPNKTLGTESLLSFPGGPHSTHCWHNSLLEELSASYGTAPGQDSWTLAPHFLQISLYILLL